MRGNFMRHVSSLTVIVALLLSTTAAAQASPALEAASPWDRWELSVGLLSGNSIADQHAETRDVLFTTVGATAGFGLGVVGSLAVFSMNPTSGHRPLEMLALGGLVAGPALGAHLGNRKRGDVWITLLATGTVVAASGAVLAAVDEPSPAYFVSIPLVTIGTAALTEILTAR